VPSAAHPAAQRLYRGDPTAGRQYGADLYLTARVDPPQFYIGDDGVLLASTSRSRWCQKRNDYVAELSATVQLLSSSWHCRTATLSNVGWPSTRRPTGTCFNSRSQQDVPRFQISEMQHRQTGDVQSCLIFFSLTPPPPGIRHAC